MGILTKLKDILNPQSQEEEGSQMKNDIEEQTQIEVQEKLSVYQEMYSDQEVESDLRNHISGFPDTNSDFQDLLNRALKYRDQGWKFFAHFEEEKEVTEYFSKPNPNTREYNDGYISIDWQETHIQEARILIKRGDSIT